MTCIVGAEADIAQVEEAIVQEDYAIAQTLAQEVLNFAVVEKTVAQRAQYYLALSQLRLGDHKSAQRIFKKLLKAKTSDQIRSQSYLGLFESYYQQGQFKKAQKLARKMMIHAKDTPFESVMYLKLARTHLKLAEWKEAKSVLNKIVRAYPQSFEAETAQHLLEEQQFFAVQVGAFLDRERAEDLIEAFRRRQEYAYMIEMKDRDNRTFYRVRVGQMTRLHQAKKLQSKLSREGFPAEIYP